MGCAPEDTYCVTRLAVAGLHLTGLLVLGHLEAGRYPTIGADATVYANTRALNLTLRDLAATSVAALMITLDRFSDYICLFGRISRLTVICWKKYS